MSERSLTDPDFQPVFRGYDRAQVDEYVRTVRDRLKELEGAMARLDTEGHGSVVPRVPEYERVGREIGTLLQEADAVARGMRERAAAEVEAAAADAAAAAKALRDDAAADAEAMRGDAWATSSELLNDAQEKATAMLAAAEDESRTVRAEAEREAHRLVAGARRESEEQIRVSKMEAERVVAEAMAERDGIVEAARRTADAAQERARALEVRRDELLHELESVRATVQRLETDIDEKRQQLEPEPEPIVAESLAMTEPEWGGGVRIIPAPEDPGPSESLGEPVDTMAVVEEVKRLRQPKGGEETVDVVTGSDGDVDDVEPADEAPALAAPADPHLEPPVKSEPPAEYAATGETDELSTLFSSLRGESPAPAPAPEPVVEAEPEAPVEVDDPIPTPRWEDDSVNVAQLIEHRQRAIIPIVNGALRGVKRDLADAQNHALEALRVEEEWTPSQSELAERFGGHLTEVRTTAYAIGWASTGSDDEPNSAPTDARSAFAGDLAASLVRASGRGADARARATEVSRAFRGWRSDSAERHLRTEAVLAYNEGVADAIASAGAPARVVAEARACSSCRETAEDAMTVVPPFHSDCTCVVTVGT